MKGGAKQYTVRNVPAHVDQALRRRARRAGKSFNQLLVETLSEAAGAGQRRYDDLDFMVGSMSKPDAEAIGREVVAQRKVDPALWR
jgi:hypothetical protein